MIKKYPFYIKSTVILFGLTLLFYALFNLKDIIIPIVFALLLAILLNTMVNWFESKKLPQVLAILISMLIAAILITTILYFISSQIVSFKTDLPLLKSRFSELFQKLQLWAKNSMGITIGKQEELINKAKTSIKPLLGQTISTLFGSLAIVILLPVYTFLFLFYKKLTLNFLFEVFEDGDSKEVKIVLDQTKGAIQSYMMGLILEGLIVATLNSAALLLLGVKYAILLGVIGAIVNVLPYIGGIIAILLPVAISTLTSNGIHTQIEVIASYLVIQFIDNHYLIPVIVSSRVKINALISIVIVLLGGALWGIPGMFLSIPFIGVVKIIFDRIPELKPWGKLLGVEIPAHHKGEKKGILKSRKTSTEK